MPLDKTDTAKLCEVLGSRIQEPGETDWAAGAGFGCSAEELQPGEGSFDHFDWVDYADAGVVGVRGGCR
jgi:hypothetical protein